MLHIGNRRIPHFGDSFIRNFNTVDVYDIDISIEKSDSFGNERPSVISFKEGNAQERLISGLFPASGIIIGSRVRIAKGDEIEEKLNTLLGKIFLSVKSVYAPLMYQRKGVVWILAPMVDMVEPTSESSSLISAIKEGVKALSVVAAMELARKQIIINYIDGDPFRKGNAIGKVVQWGMKKKGYLTAQTIRL